MGNNCIPLDASYMHLLASCNHEYHRMPSFSSCIPLFLHVSFCIPLKFISPCIPLYPPVCPYVPRISLYTPVSPCIPLYPPVSPLYLPCIPCILVAKGQVRTTKYFHDKTFKTVGSWFLVLGTRYCFFNCFVAIYFSYTINKNTF